MASKLREERFEKNRKDLEKINNTFRMVMILGVVCTLGIFVVLYLIYLIKGMALAAGSSMFFAQKILSEAGLLSEAQKPHADQFPFFWMFYLLTMAVTTFLGTMFRIKKVNYFIFAAYFWTLIYGVFSAFTGKEGLLFSLVLIIGGLIGLWLTNLTFNLYKSLDELSLQEGFPDFIVAIDEPHAIPNTTGVYYKKYLYMKQQNEKKKSEIEKQLNDLGATFTTTDDLGICTDSGGSAKAEMDELSVEIHGSMEQLLKDSERYKK